MKRKREYSGYNENGKRNMIPGIYDIFSSWYDGGRIFLISDTHFDDADCHKMDPNWISPEEHCAYIKSKVHKNDTLIHLGDVGNMDRIDTIWKKGKAPHLVLIMGNHDQSIEEAKRHFDEVYRGPLFIGEKLVLSHEPIGLDWCMNVHGHQHDPRQTGGCHDVNIASNVYGYRVMDLKEEIEHGLLSRQPGIHRPTIERATERKDRRTRRNR